jgi:hypothetical protein
MVLSVEYEEGQRELIPSALPTGLVRFWADTYIVHDMRELAIVTGNSIIS